MDGMLRLGMSTAGATLGLVVIGWFVALLWVPVWLAGGTAGASGLPMALLLWLTVVSLAFGLGVGAWVGWRLGQRLVGEPEEPIILCCEHCGYNLRGSTSDACPECGTAIPAAQRQVIERFPPHPRATP